MGKVRKMERIGLKVMEKGGKKKLIEEKGVEQKKIKKVIEGSKNVEEEIRNRKINMVLKKKERESEV